MKTKIFLKLGLAIIMASLFSCEEWVTMPNNQGESNGPSGYYVEFSKPLDLPEIANDYCGEIRLFELWYNDPSWGVYGTVVVYNDGEKLYVQYDIHPDSVSAGWYIAETYLFIGGEWLWFNGTEPKEPDWTTDYYSVISRDVHAGYASRVILDIRIEDLELDCFYLGVKARLEHQYTDENAYPRAYINKTGSFLEKLWGTSFCLEPCEVP